MKLEARISAMVEMVVVKMKEVVRIQTKMDMAIAEMEVAVKELEVAMMEEEMRISAEKETVVKEMDVIVCWVGGGGGSTRS